MPSAPPSAEAEPLFASDEEALAAAEAAFSEYLDRLNGILQNGGERPEELRPFVSDEVWEEDLADIKRWQDGDLRTIGATTLDNIRLQQVYSSDADTTEVITYNCISNEGVDVVDANGVSVVSPDRALKYVVEATVSFAPSGDFTIEAYDDVDAAEVCA